MVASKAGKIRVGNLDYMLASGLQVNEQVSEKLQALQMGGKTAVLVALDSGIIALLGMQDVSIAFGGPPVPMIRARMLGEDGGPAL